MEIRAAGADCYDACRAWEGERVTFELVEFCEPASQAGQPFSGTSERVIATYGDESEAITMGRSLRKDAKALVSSDVMWWIVRVRGEALARWIADKGSDEERILDLTTNELVRVQ